MPALIHTQKVECAHSQPMALVSLPGAGSRTPEPEPLAHLAQNSVVCICHMHLGDRDVRMEGDLQNSMAQTVGSEQKTVIHGTLMIFMNVKEKLSKKKKEKEKDFHSQMFDKVRVNQG